MRKAKVFFYRRLGRLNSKGWEMSGEVVVLAMQNQILLMKKERLTRSCLKNIKSAAPITRSMSYPDGLICKVFSYFS